MSDLSTGNRSLAQWLDYQQQLHPQSIELGLGRVRVVAETLQLLPTAGVTVVVAGTNGKGSSVAMLEAIYLAAGYRVGSYTSPHLHDYCERVRINGAPVSEQAFCTAFEAIERARGTTQLTFFEFGTLAALQIMRDEELDVQLLEVGLGGRLDAVNIVDSDLALITQIDLDHRDWLGDTRESVGAEKAGIMRSGRPVVCGDRNPPYSLRARARELGVRAFRLGEEFDFDEDPAQRDWQVQFSDNSLQLPRPKLFGRGQLENAAAVVQVVDLLQPRLPVEVAALAKGLGSVSLPGRFERQEGVPSVIFDVAHNPQACRGLAENLQMTGRRGNRKAILGMLVDKELAACLHPLLNQFDSWYLATLAEPRGASANELQAALVSLGCTAPMVLCDSVSQAMQQAKGSALPEDCLVVFGSFHTVAAAR